MPRKKLLDELRAMHKVRKNEIRSRLREFHSVPPSEYFYELCYCLLTPQTNAFNAAGAVDELKANSFRERAFDPEPVLRNPRRYIRFHATKAKRLLELREIFPRVESHLASNAPAAELRERLVKETKGLGMKEATHFLRNIGKNEGLAILDRHILRNLVRYGAVGALPVSLTKKQYLAVERRFQRFAVRIGIPLDELDLLFWSYQTGSIFK